MEKTIYAVTYRDDKNRKHLTFLKGFNAVKFIMTRFDNVTFEPTCNYNHEVNKTFQSF